jgi:hypothetical protein
MFYFLWLPKQPDDFNDWFSLLHFLYHLYHSPTFGFAQRTAFHNLYDVPDAALILFVVSMKTGCFFQKLAIKWVLDFTFHFHGNGFVHFIGRDHPDPGFP